MLSDVQKSDSLILIQNYELNKIVMDASLDQEEITNLDLWMDEGSLATDVAGLLHSWCSAFSGYLGKLTYHPPHN